ncbi:MAG: septation protein SpoVG family protein [Planctomycetes bacterium]|nr:septation protein SpoVG family protein [Planctomycetota bacterium]
MEITEVRVKLMENSDDRLQAFCSVTFDDCFVVRDLKIIEGSNGPFVAMPSRKMTVHCPRCHCKNHSRAAYCNQCGTQQQQCAGDPNDDSRGKLYADIAHPINAECREMIQEKVIQRYQAELEDRATKASDAYQRQDTVTPDESVPIQGPHQGARQEAVEPPVDGDNGFGQGIFPEA